MNKIIITLSLATVLFGQLSFTSHTITTNADYATSVFAIDIDNDGDMDVLSTSAYDATVAWYENDGSETFSEHEITTDALGAISAHAADIDNDGDIDIVSANRSEEKVQLFLNNGSQSFVAILIQSNATTVSTAFAIDFDRDGDMDIVTSGAFGLKWFANSGGTITGSESFTEYYFYSYTSGGFQKIT